MVAGTGACLKGNFPRGTEAALWTCITLSPLRSRVCFQTDWSGNRLGIAPLRPEGHSCLFDA